MTTQHPQAGNTGSGTHHVLESIKAKLHQLSGRGNVPGHELKTLVTEIENAQAQHQP